LHCRRAKACTDQGGAGVTHIWDKEDLIFNNAFERCANFAKTGYIDTMDPISLTCYAVVCSALTVVAPRLGGIAPRLIVGAIVGVLTAIVLPTLRLTIGY
jgi:hypothetical protein